MDINANILAACELLNDGHWAEAEKHLDLAVRSFHYGTGKSELDWRGFTNLAHIARQAVTSVIIGQRRFSLCPITPTTNDLGTLVVEDTGL